MPCIIVGADPSTALGGAAEVALQLSPDIRRASEGAACPESMRLATAVLTVGTVRWPINPEERPTLEDGLLFDLVSLGADCSGGSAEVVLPEGRLEVVPPPFRSGRNVHCPSREPGTFSAAVELLPPDREVGASWR